jgi:hypothetical protein
MPCVVMMWRGRAREMLPISTLDFNTIFHHGTRYGNPEGPCYSTGGGNYARCPLGDGPSMELGLEVCVTDGAPGFCKDYNPNVALECYCQDQCPTSPSPPAPATPPPPVQAGFATFGTPCSSLVPDDAECGAERGGGVCWNCCSGTGFCGRDDGNGPWCGNGTQADYSYALIDPTSKRCGVRFQPKQCVVNPATGRSVCVSLPEGYSINSNTPEVQRMLRRSFKADNLSVA